MVNITERELFKQSKPKRHLSEICIEIFEQNTNEPRREKTGLRGFRPGPTQTGLYKLRKELEA